MATNIWISTGSNDIGNTANWSLGALNNTDTLTFLNASSTVPATADGADLTAYDFAGIHVERDWPSNIGAVGNPVICSATRIEYFGVGQFYFQDSAGTTDNVLVDSRRDTGTDCMQIAGDTCTNVEVLRGKVTVANASTVTNLYVGYVNNPSSDAKVVLSSNVDAMALLVMNGGHVEVNMSTNAITLALIMSGMIDINSATMTKIIQSGGVVNLKTSTAVAELVAMGGLFDCTRNSLAKTITVLEQLGGEVRTAGVPVTVTTYKKYAGK